VALASGDADDVLRAFDALAAERERRTYVLSDDLLQFDLFLGARWLAARGVRVPEPLPFLQRAYQELLRKTSFLEPALRQRFLRIPEHQAIVDAATVARLPLPAS
jgi:glutathione S-transferase